MLSNILGPINTTLATLWANDFPDAPALQMFTGAEYLAGQDSAGRIVWVPTADKYDGISKQTFSSDTGPEFGGIPRNLRNRQTTVACHIWGAPPADPTQLDHYFDGVEQLLTLVVQAIHQNCHGIYRLLGGEYPPITREAGFSQYGRVYVLHLEFETPLVDDSQGYTLHSPTTFPITSEVEMPS